MGPLTVIRRAKPKYSYNTASLVPDNLARGKGSGYHWGWVSCLNSEQANEIGNMFTLANQTSLHHKNVVIKLRLLTQHNQGNIQWSPNPFRLERVRSGDETTSLPAWQLWTLRLKTEVSLITSQRYNQFLWNHPWATLLGTYRFGHLDLLLKPFLSHTDILILGFK